MNFKNYSNLNCKKEETKRSSKVDYYFSNLYSPSDNIEKYKLLSMPDNVRRDLEPFKAYLGASKNAQEKSVTEGADVVVLKNNNETVLKPQFKIYKANSAKTVLEIEKPLNIFKIECDDFDSEKFDIIKGRNETICDNKVDLYNGVVFVKIENFIYSNENFNLWSGNENTPKICHICKVDFKDKDSYRIEGIDTEKVSNIKCENETIIIQTNCKPKRIKICGVDCKFTQKEIKDYSQIPYSIAIDEEYCLTNVNKSLPPPEKFYRII